MRFSTVLLTLILVASLGKLAWRGVLDVHADLNDLRFLFIEAKAWAAGDNPYRLEDVDKHARIVAGFSVDHASGVILSPYPPSIFPVMSPLLLLSWPQARVVAMIAWFLLVLAVPIALCRILHLRCFACVALITLTLAISPVRLGLRLGQPGLFSAMLLILAVAIPRTKFLIGVGLLVGIAAAIKAPLGVPIILLLLIEKRWNSLASAIITCAALFLIGAIPLWLHHPTWPADLATAIESGVRPGGFNDASPDNPLRFQMVNLQAAVFAFASSRVVVQTIVWTITGMLFGIWTWVAWTRQPSTLLAGAGVMTIALLPSYHRPYDSAVLLAGSAFAIMELTKRDHFRPQSRVILITLVTLSLVQLIPGPETFGSFAWRLPVSFVNSSIWEGIVLPFQCWVIFLTAVAILYAMIDVSTSNALRDKAG